MAMPDSLASLHVPPVGDNAILCVGLRLEGDAQDWITASLPFVTRDERERAGRFIHAADAARHMVGRALARRCLEAALNRPVPEAFSVTRWGKPQLEDTDVDFSISHSGGMVWTALCRSCHVGIDVEEIRPVPELEVLAAALHPHEQAGVFAVPEEERLRIFYRCWTRKEAVLKAAGTGLNMTMDSFQVCTDRKTDAWLISLPPDDTPETGDSEGSGCWTVRDINTEAAYHCSMAACAPQLDVAVFRLPDAAPVTEQI
ncbi:4'-phosphopantetheinyl transferase superfamily protein [Desulfovibrio subterraneus]|uniref:4'-phosphopantetheinyl transferase family protein n=1 Tax=Desulfovibrio subterraneus TaxID=2718620 RepID=UPI0022B88038|nr:4'-phosphopantetheinyl transferase superfamily protein [Desulfovibrio subterraneus]WBF66257.1 4'-phosphopantetheinyl transferase superfamily protein [Desulfovibrio subterraneus]